MREADTYLRINGFIHLFRKRFLSTCHVVGKYYAYLSPSAPTPTKAGTVTNPISQIRNLRWGAGAALPEVPMEKAESGLRPRLWTPGPGPQQDVCLTLTSPALPEPRCACVRGPAAVSGPQRRLSLLNCHSHQRGWREMSPTPPRVYGAGCFPLGFLK